MQRNSSLIIKSQKMVNDYKKDILEATKNQDQRYIQKNVVSNKFRPQPLRALQQKNLAQRPFEKLSANINMLSRSYVDNTPQIDFDSKRNFPLQKIEQKRVAPEKQYIEIQSPVKVMYSNPYRAYPSEMINSMIVQQPEKIFDLMPVECSSQKKEYQGSINCNQRKRDRPLTTSLVVDNRISSRQKKLKRVVRPDFLSDLCEKKLSKGKNSNSVSAFDFQSPLKMMKKKKEKAFEMQVRDQEQVPLSDIKKVKSNNANNTLQNKSWTFDSQKKVQKKTTETNYDLQSPLKKISAFKQRLRPRQKQFCIDDFQIQDKIGKGAFGDVFIARQKKIGFICAMKCLSKKKIKQQGLQEQVMREIKIQSYLNHKHITSLYGVFDDESKIYLIVQCMPDGSMPRSKKKISEPETAYYVKQVCLGLQFMHQQDIIHRDIKPQNLFMNDGYIKLGDFGCSVFSETFRKTVVGCFAYISPQQFNNMPYNDKIDAWSVGILTYELLFGKPPFEQELFRIVGSNKSNRGTGQTLVSVQEQQFPVLTFPQQPKISRQAQQMIQFLLLQNSAQRMDIKQALRHSFLKKSQEWQQYLLKQSQIQK